MATKYLDNPALTFGVGNKVVEGINKKTYGHHTQLSQGKGYEGSYTTFNDKEITIWNWHESASNMNNGEFRPDINIIKIVGDFVYSKDGKATGDIYEYYTSNIYYLANYNFGIGASIKARLDRRNELDVSTIRYEQLREFMSWQESIYWDHDVSSPYKITNAALNAWNDWSNGSIDNAETRDVLQYIVDSYSSQNFNPTDFAKAVDGIKKSSNNESNESSANSFEDAFAPQDSIATFELSNPKTINNKSFAKFITGTNRKDNIKGDSSSNLLCGFTGKDKLIGGLGSDGFIVGATGVFTKKNQSTIKDFKRSEGDLILLDSNHILIDIDINMTSVESKKSFKAAKKNNSNVIYYKSKGLLFYDQNREDSGFGDGGIIAKLLGKPELTVTDIAII